MKQTSNTFAKQVRLAEIEALHQRLDAAGCISTTDAQALRRAVGDLLMINQAVAFEADIEVKRAMEMADHWLQVLIDESCQLARSGEDIGHEPPLAPWVYDPNEPEIPF